MALAARTSVALFLAASSITGAIVLTQRQPERSEPVGCVLPKHESRDDGFGLTARFTSQQVMRGEQLVAVTIATPDIDSTEYVRPPLAMAIVVDRSGSMDGAPMKNAREAAKRMVDTLGEQDVFSIITFSDGVETVAPMAAADAVHKDLAKRAIDGIRADGVTCASCGLDRAAKELALEPNGTARSGFAGPRSPAEGQGGESIDRVHRIVFVSDGEANAGIYDREELVKHVGELAAHGTSVTAVGVGLLYDEVTMTSIAEVGRGNYYFVEDTAKLDDMFQRELGGLTHTIATNVNLVIRPGAGFDVVEAYGYPLTHTSEGTFIPVADLRSSETRKVVLRVNVTAADHVELLAQLNWRRVGDGEGRGAGAVASAQIVEDRHQVEATIDVQANTAVQQALNAKALETATAVYESQGYEAAKQVMDHRKAEIHAMPASAADPKMMNALDEDNNAVIETLKKAPAAKATKAVRAKAFEQSR